MIHLRPIDVEYCRAIMHERGPTYLTATKWFKLDIRQKVYILYAFLREPDDIVDELDDVELKTKKLARWREDWELAWFHPDAAISPVLKSASILFQSHQITWDETEAFFVAMEQDLQSFQIQTLSDLQVYMYGSAGVVGVMMTKLLLPPNKWQQPNVLQHAKLLGDAMQLTNFLRDIASDYTDRKRIYIPKEILDIYGVTIDHFETQKNDKVWKNALEHCINLVESWYDEAEMSLGVFPRAMRQPIRYASKLYRFYVTLIRQADYDVWNHDFHLTKMQKFKQLLFS